MKSPSSLPLWSFAAPLIGWLLLVATFLTGPSSLLVALLIAALIGSVLAAVHHAEVVAHRVGEPYGTLVLALAITIIEVALIVSLMLSGGPQSTALARDTVFAAVMLILSTALWVCVCWWVAVASRSSPLVFME